MFILKNFLLYRRLVKNQYRWDHLQSKNFIYIVVVVVVVVVERVTVEIDSTERVRLVARQSHISDIKGITKVSDWGGICLIQP